MRANGELTGSESNWKRGIQAAEIRVRATTTMARSTVVTWCTAVVALCQHRRAPNGHQPLSREMFCHGILHHQFGTIHFHGRQEFPIWQLRQSFILPCDAYEIFYVVVPRGDVFVADGPVRGDTLSQIGLEIQVAPAIRLPSPHNGSAAHLASANPQERLVRVGDIGILRVIHKKFRGPLVACVTLALNRLLHSRSLAVAQTTKTYLPSRNVFDEIRIRFDRASRLQDQRIETLLGEFLVRPAAGDPGTYDKRVVFEIGHP